MVIIRSRLTLEHHWSMGVHMAHATTCVWLQESHVDLLCAALPAEPNFSRSKPALVWRRLAAVRRPDLDPSRDDGGAACQQAAVPYGIWCKSETAARGSAAAAPTAEHMAG